MNGDSRSWQTESGMGGSQRGCLRNFKNCFGFMVRGADDTLVMEDSPFAMVR